MHLGPVLLFATVATSSASEALVRLDNGLRVVIDQDPTSPRFALVVGYGSGSGDDPPDRAELAHLTEHVTFRPLDAYLAQAAARGAERNAITFPYATIYWVVENAAYLEHWLWLESKRMATLAVAEEDVYREREIVTRELAQRDGLNLAIRAFIEGRLYPAAERWRTLPERRESLARLTPADVEWFHRTHYRPENALVVVSSLYDRETVLAAVRRFFGTLKSTSAADLAPSPAPGAQKPCNGGVLDVLSGYRVARVQVHVRVAGSPAPLWMMGRTLMRRLEALSYGSFGRPDFRFDLFTRRKGYELVFIVDPLPGTKTRSLARYLEQQWQTVVGRPVDNEEWAEARRAYRAARQLGLTTRAARMVDRAQGLLGEAAPGLRAAPRPDPRPLAEAGRLFVSTTYVQHRTEPVAREVKGCE